MFDIICLDAQNPGPLTGTGNHTYLLVASDAPAVLIDAGVGHPGHLAAIQHHLDVRRAWLELVLVTHAHEDHIHGVPALARAHPAARFAKRGRPDRDPRYRVPWQTLNDGDRVPVPGDSLEVVLTPGHSDDHVAFWHEESRTVWTGDLVVEGTSVMLDWSGGADLASYLASLERILALDPRRLFPAHGPEVTDPSALLRQYLTHRRHREVQIAAALEAGARTVPAIVETIYDGLTPSLRAAAADTVRAHLEKLRREGRAVERNGDWAPHPPSGTR